jgi:hypothetical protein
VPAGNNPQQLYQAIRRYHKRNKSELKGEKEIISIREVFSGTAHLKKAQRKAEEAGRVVLSLDILQGNYLATETSA